MKVAKGHTIVIVGCGNVAWQLAKHFCSLGKYTVSVYNHRRNTKLSEFSRVLKCKVYSTLELVAPDADYYFICVSDQAVQEVAGKININNPDALLVHTSGSLKLKVLGNRVHGTGVFYPLQTFSKADVVNWKEIPILVESDQAWSEKKLLALASKFSHTCLHLPYEDRLHLHLAAVLVNNFTNALYVAAKDLVGSKPKGANFGHLMPLIKRTVAKLEIMSPLAAQTGPAKRKDSVVMNKHLALLNKHKKLRSAYKILSSLIEKQQKK